MKNYDEDLQRHKGFNFAYMDGPDGPFSTIVYVQNNRFWTNVQSMQLDENVVVYPNSVWNGELHKYKIMALKPIDTPSWQDVEVTWAGYQEQKEQQQ